MIPLVLSFILRISHFHFIEQMLTVNKIGTSKSTKLSNEICKILFLLLVSAKQFKIEKTLLKRPFPTE